MGEKTTGISGGGGFFARRIMADLFDGVDEDRAVKLRINLGRRQWLVSWEPHEDGTWLARISPPGLSRTIVRHGRTRVDAIERAARTLRQAMELRLKRGQTG